MKELTAALVLALLTASAATAAAGWLAWLAPRRRGAELLADALGAFATALALAAWIVRWAASGHLPLFGTWESALSLALAVLAASWVPRRPDGRWIRPWAVTGLVAALLLLHARGYSSTAYALTISERSWVVDIHAVLAWAAFATLAVNAAFGVALLLGRDRLRDVAGRALSTSLSAGFVLHTAMMASGSFYKFLLFGEAWTFDPIEILGFMAWIAYATLLHLHWMGGWEGRRLARWCLGVFLLLVVSYRGIVYFPGWSTYHIFDMDLRVHITGTETP